jgi:hypothetical protein
MPIVTINKEVPIGALRLHPFIQEFRHGENEKSRDARIQYLVQNWSEELVGRLAVVPSENGAFYVVEGGHRFPAARILAENGKRTDPCLPCEVLRGVEWDDKPSLARWVLGRLDARQWTNYNKFALLRDAGLEPAATIESIVQMYGSRTVSPGSSGYSCVAKLEAVFKDGVLSETIKVIETAWPGNQDAKTSLMVGAIGKFVAFYHGNAQYDTTTLIDKLSRRAPRALTVEARANSWARRTSAIKSLCVGILEVYNHKRVNRLPEFHLKGAQ